MQAQLFQTFLFLALDFLAPALLFSLGAYLVWSGALRKMGPRPGIDSKCPACGYIVSHSPSPHCPECGVKRDEPTSRQRIKLKKLRTTIGILLCLPGLWVLCFCLYYFPKTYYQNWRTQQALTLLRTDLTIDVGPYYKLKADSSPPTWTLWIAHHAWDWLAYTRLFKVYGDFDYLPYTRSSIDIYFPHATTDKVLHTLVSWTWCPSLNYIDYMPLQVVPELDCGEWEPSAPLNAPLTTLTPDQVLALSRLQGIEKLRIFSSIKVDDQALAQFASFSNIGQYIAIDNIQLDPRQSHIWDTAAPITELTYIDINSPGAIPAGFFKAIQTSKLQGLTIQDLNRTPHTLTDQPYMVQGIAQLQHIADIRFFRIDAGTSAQRNQAFNLCARMPNLSTLSILGLDIPPSSLENLKCNTQLVILELGFAKDSAITDENLGYLTSFEQLRNFSLRNTPQVKGAFLHTLQPHFTPPHSSSLTLEMDNTGVDLDSLLAIPTDKFGSLTLKRTKITPQDIITLLKQQTHLWCLHYDQPPTQALCDQIGSHSKLSQIRLTGVDDQGLDAIVKCATLRHVTIDSSRLSPARRAAINAGTYPPFKDWISGEPPTTDKTFMIND